MFFTIEPMVNLGKPQVKLLADGWTAVTRDKSLSAQCEHSVGVTETGVEIFTLSERHGEKMWFGVSALDKVNSRSASARRSPRACGSRRSTSRRCATSCTIG